MEHKLTLTFQKQHFQELVAAANKLRLTPEEFVVKRLIELFGPEHSQKQTTTIGEGADQRPNSEQQ